MYQIKSIFRFPQVGLIALSIFLFGCIEEFTPPEIEDIKDLLVIEGSIIKGDTIQKVLISWSADINEPAHKPVTGCIVSVTNENGQNFSFEEKSPGNYQASIPQTYLQYGSRFKLLVSAKDNKNINNEYESDYEPILESSPVDNIYHLVEDYQTSSEYHAEGLQFYADLKAPDGNTQNYRWTIEETWEYRSKYIIEAYYDKSMDSILMMPSLSDSIKYCWSTLPVSGLYSSSTQNLTVNEKKKIPLSYVPSTSYKLSVMYSLLVKQYALSEEAYLYWNKNKVETQESGGLYQTQPSLSKSNIRNLTNPEEIVLGFFWASSYTEKRIFFKGPFKTPVYKYECDADTFDIDDPGLRPTIWLTNISEQPMMEFVPGVAAPLCFDCTLQGGTTHKPDFWK